jgi:lipopolysaccharide export system protein LptA
MIERHRNEWQRWAALALLVALLPVSSPPPSSLAAAIDGPSGASSKDWARSGFLGDFTLGSSREPIRVSADVLEFDYKSRVLVYRGGVEVTQGDLALRSKTLTVYFDERAVGRDRLKNIVAEGEVRIGKGARFATGGRAVFDQASQTVTLSEDAVLHDGENRVAGERVVVYLDEGRSVVEGGRERVRAVLIPPSDSKSALTTGKPDDGERSN